MVQDLILQEAALLMDRTKDTFESQVQGRSMLLTKYDRKLRKLVASKARKWRPTTA